MGSRCAGNEAAEALQRHAPEYGRDKGAENEARAIQPAYSWESVQDHLHIHEHFKQFLSLLLLMIDGEQTSAPSSDAGLVYQTSRQASIVGFSNYKQVHRNEAYRVEAAYDFTTGE